MIYETKTDPIYIHKKDSFDFVPHAHHNLEVMICLEGLCQASCNFRTELLHPGDVMIAFSNDIHSYIKTGAGKGITAIIAPSLLQNFEPYTDGKHYENFLFAKDDELIRLSEALYAEYIGDQSMEIMIGYLYVILGKIMKVLPFTEQEIPIDAEQFSKILKYLSEHYRQKISLKSVGKKFGISPCHLSRTFTQKLSCSFLRYLHILRVEHAKNLLKHSGMSILEIAYESGFSDQRTFNRVFKELTDRTPKDYRVTHTDTQ